MSASRARPTVSSRRLVVAFAAGMVAMWLVSWLPAGQAVAWFSLGVLLLVGFIAGVLAENALEVVAVAVGAAVGTGWGGLTQVSLPGGPSADEVVSTSLGIGLIVLVVGGGIFALRVLREGARPAPSGLRGLLGRPRR